MYGANKFSEDFGRVFSGFLGVAQGARSEAETAFRSWMDQFMDAQGYVSQDEFAAMSALCQKNREEIEELKAIIAELKAQSK